MDLTVQTKLLRFLQDKTFLGLGWTRPRRADVRIIAATQSPQTTLRKDILGRLGADPVVLPALRRRREDLPALCRHFLRRLPPEQGVRGLERTAGIAFCLYSWPRNIRELEATIAEGALSAAERGSARIDLQDLPGRLRDLLRQPPTEADESGPDHPRPEAAVVARRERPTRSELEELLRAHRGHVPAVARQLERRRELVWRWCRLDGIDPTAFRDAKEAEQAGAGVKPHQDGPARKHG
jgi:transcriptional regulator with PAS, ATPase and Fis domain